MRVLRCEGGPGSTEGSSTWVLRLGLALVGFLEQLPEVLGHEVRLLCRAIVALQVLHCKEKSPGPTGLGVMETPGSLQQGFPGGMEALGSSFSTSDTANPTGIEKKGDLGFCFSEEG